MVGVTPVVAILGEAIFLCLRQNNPCVMLKVTIMIIVSEFIRWCSC